MNEGFTELPVAYFFLIYPLWSDTDAILVERRGMYVGLPGGLVRRGENCLESAERMLVREKGLMSFTRYHPNLQVKKHSLFRKDWEGHPYVDCTIFEFHKTHALKAPQAAKALFVNPLKTNTLNELQFDFTIEQFLLSRGAPRQIIPDQKPSGATVAA